MELPTIRTSHVSHASCCLDLSRGNPLAFVCLLSNRKLTHHLTALRNTDCSTAGWEKRLSRHTGNALQESESCTLRRYHPSPWDQRAAFLPSWRFCSTCLWFSKRHCFATFPLKPTCSKNNHMLLRINAENEI